jgi:hypothetical protein
VRLPVHFPDFVKSFFKAAAASYWGKMPRNKRSNGFAVGNSIEEEVKMAVGMSVRDFMNDHSRMELSFPSSLTREQRAFVHQLVSGEILHKFHCIPVTKCHGTNAWILLNFFRVIAGHSAQSQVQEQGQGPESVLDRV